MRRALTAVVGTVVGLVGLLGYKSGSPPARQVAGSTSTAAPPRPSPTTTPTPTPTVPPTGPSTTAPATTVPSGDGSFPGPVVNTRYGPVQVQVTLSGGQLVEVVALELPNERPRSAAISTRAAPVLRREALASQGTHVDTVSGATYTSEGYAESLQAALDRARR